MSRFACLPVVILTLTAAFASNDRSLARAAQTPPTYEEFVKLPAEQREAVFAQLSADMKAAFLRRRFESWLAEHRPHLNARQIATVQEAIDLVSPKMFDQPPAEKDRARQDAVAKKLYCSLGSDLAYSFARGETPTKVDRTWSQALHAWTDWVVDCVMR